MATFKIYFTRTVAYEATVEAESESAARQCWIDGDFDKVERLDEEPGEQMYAVREVAS